MNNTDPPLFKTVDGALGFAFNYVHGQFAPTALADMVYARKAGRGLGGLAGAAQAGLIEHAVIALGRPDAKEPKWIPRPLWPHILMARYAARSVPCSCKRACCAGRRRNEDWEVAISEIAEVVMTAALAGTTVNFTLRQAIVRRYFGERNRLQDVAKAADVHRDTASDHAKRVLAYLREEERKARYAIEGRLKEAGVIE